MFDDITKALTIKITADDLTGGVWADIGKAGKDLMALATPFNQAWELSSKIIGTVASAMEKPIQWLSEGGEFSEAQAGLDALAKSYQVNGQAMLSTIREMSDGSLDLVAATKVTSDAIEKGFSGPQVEAIWSFAQKYVDTMGDRNGGVLEVAQKIQDAVFTGKGKSTKALGLDIYAGESFAEIEKQLNSLKEKMGAGAFNFGEELEKMGTAVKDAGLKIKTEMNDVLSWDDNEGFAGFARSIVEDLRSVEDLAPEIAYGIMKPFMDAIDSAWSPIKDFFWLIGEQFGTLFDESDTLGIKMTTIFSAIANSGYELAELLVLAIDAVMFPFNEATKTVFDLLEALYKAELKAAEWTGNTEAIDSLKMSILEVQELGKTGILTTGGLYNDISNKQREYNENMLKIQGTINHTNEAHKELSKGVLKAGESFESATKKQAKHKDTAKELTDQNKALAKSYEDVGKSLAEGIKATGSIITEQQKGINDTAGALTDLFSGNYDSYRDTEKRRELESLMNRQAEAKKEADKLLEKQANAQIKLAEALEFSNKNPRVIEFRAPNDPNTVENFISYTVDWLVQRAREEGTPIQA